MSWIRKLYETYENCESDVGKVIGGSMQPLLPIAHALQRINIEVIIDYSGNFRNARVLPQDDSLTVIPCTEESVDRRKKINECPHPLADKLQFVAGDYKKYVKAGKEEICFDNYHKLLNQWCESDYCHWKAKAVLLYIQKERLINDLVDCKILYLDSDGQKLLDKWKARGKKPEVFESLKQNETQPECYIRWNVIKSGELNSTTWNDKSLWESWAGYYKSTKNDEDLCYVTGKKALKTLYYPAKVRNNGDMAKIISSNDKINFTYRGRFDVTDRDKVCNVSYDAAQKSHYALKWLISRQSGHTYGNKVIVSWSTIDKSIPDIMASTNEFKGMEDNDDEDKLSNTFERYADKLNKAIAGYSQNINDANDIVVMSVDSTSDKGKGRLSITYYRELSGSAFLERIRNWHSTCVWKHDYLIKSDIANPDKKIHYSFIGAPAPRDIVKAVYGKSIKSTDKLMSSTIERLLPCIIDGRSIPRDLVEVAISRASCRVGKEKWEWRKSLTIACALYRKYIFDERKKEVCGLELDKSNTDRSYLYGRLLAVADVIEERVLRKTDENRLTNAARWMNRFYLHPFEEWERLHRALGPYEKKLGRKVYNYYKNEICNITNSFVPGDFTSNRKLTGEYLLGYYCELESLNTYKKVDNQNLQDKKEDEI